MGDFYRVEDLVVYQKLCDLHIEVCDVSRKWPEWEKYELAPQVRRSWNSAPANLAEKHNDRHVRNRIEGVNRERGETLETVHHLYIAQRKGYITAQTFESYRERYFECVRMLNGLERALERQLSTDSHLWPDHPPSPLPPR